ANYSAPDSFTYKANDGTADSGFATVTITVIPAPTTATGPSDLTVCEGQSASFSTSAQGTGPFTYESSKDGVNIGGATHATYTIDPVSAADTGSYCVVVTGDA